MKVPKTTHILFALCFLSLSPFTNAAEVTVGDEKISIPSPSGFSEISSISPETVQLFEDMCPPTNRLLAVFLSQGDVGRLIQGKATAFDSYMMVHSSKKLETFSLAKYQFKEVRTAMRSQYDSLFEEHRESIDKIVGQAGQAISKRIDAEVALDIGDIVPLGIDFETASSITASQLVKYSVKVADENVEYVMAGTVCTLLVKGKVIYLYIYKTYNDKSDLDWTRKTTKSWTNNILSANNITLPMSSGRIVPEGTTLDPVVKELLVEKWIRYSIKSHPKSEGLDISIEYPQSWRSEEGIRPHIVQKFTGNSTAGISLSCILLVRKLPTWASIFLKGEIAENMLSEGLQDMLPTNAQFIDGSQTKIDGEPGAWVKYYYETESAGIRAGIHCLQYVLFFRGKMFITQCFVGGIAEDKELLQDAFNSYLPVFQMMGGSIVIQDKWSGTGKVTWDSALREVFGEYWLLALVLSAILTWGIGLAPPLIIRFVLARRPLSKGLSITIAVLFWFFNFVLFTALGSESKTHAALFLVALASYAILRKGGRQLSLFSEKERKLGE